LSLRRSPPVNRVEVTGRVASKGLSRLIDNGKTPPFYVFMLYVPRDDRDVAVRGDEAEDEEVFQVELRENREKLANVVEPRQAVRVRGRLTRRNNYLVVVGESIENVS
jgi:hypothetical protein